MRGRLYGNILINPKVEGEKRSQTMLAFVQVDLRYFCLDHGVSYPRSRCFRQKSLTN